MWATDTDSGFIYLEDGDVYRHMSDVGATVEVVEFNKATADPRTVRPCLEQTVPAAMSFAAPRQH